MPANNIGDARLAFAAKRGCKLTQEDAARLVGVSLSTYRNWEQGRNLPDVKSAMKLADEFGVTIDHLLGKTNPERATSRQLFAPVPLCGTITSGASFETLPVESMKEAPASFLEGDPNCFLARVPSGSASRVVQSGDFVLVSPKYREPSSTGMFLVTVSGTPSIMRLRLLENGVELVPDSYDPTFRPIVVDYSEQNAPSLDVLGKVVWWCAEF